MPVVLMCAPDPLVDDLHGTVLWRSGIERHVASRFEDALVTAVAARPHLVVVDRDLPQAERLVADLRGNPTTRGCSIAIVARGDLQPTEVRLIEVGANAILRLPASAEWDERLARLIAVPARRRSRASVTLEFEGKAGIERVSGRIADISVTGMAVRCACVLTLGRDLDFSFTLHGGTPIVGCGRVVRLGRPGRYGVEFYGLEGNGVERVRAFVEGAPAGGGRGRN